MRRTNGRGSSWWIQSGAAVSGSHSRSFVPVLPSNPCSICHIIYCLQSDDWETETEEWSDIEPTTCELQYIRISSHTHTHRQSSTTRSMIILHSNNLYINGMWVWQFSSQDMSMEKNEDCHWTLFRIFNLSKVVGNSMDSELNYSLSLFTDEFFFSDSGSGQKINWKLK